ncbi:Valine--tRNA ligase mitochondrial 1 [Bienertia sinuspersici]
MSIAVGAKEKELKKQKAALKAEAAKLQGQQASNTSKKTERKNSKKDAVEEDPQNYLDPETSLGEKKKLSQLMAKQYLLLQWKIRKSIFLKVLSKLVCAEPLTFRSINNGCRWYDWWEKSGFFVAESNSSKPPFVIVLPPPNVTGALHIGHALTGAIEDTIIRWRRMSGYNTLWVPGMDHAGIATQVDYIDLKGKELRKVPGYKDPVEFGVLTSFAYPLEENLGEIVVATTRVETMLGDTAIAVHPDDCRYKHLHGKVAIHPFNGRKIPIVCDAILVDPAFGTGAVKITPAHDPNDFEVGKRHQLEFINIFTDDGNINSNGGPEFAGMPRFEARVSVTKALEEKGLYRGSKDNEMRLGVCSRSNDVVEPLIKPQWYVNCNTMAKDALDAVMDDENRKIEIIPKEYAAEWKRWLENIRDWCISRQLWWGHRIPAWYVTLESDQLKELGTYSNHWVVCRSEEEAQAEAARRFAGQKFQIAQDPDVLDTWFSSGLFPLSVLGWPDETDDLKNFYPTSILETGHDILFFWVARMVMLGMKLGGDVPFRKVYLHPMIRDAHGRKMSKSLGNVVDPLEVINGISLEDLQKRLEEGNLDPSELAKAKDVQRKDFPSGIPECGADALRFALVSYTAQSDKINLDIQRVVGYRQWCNKLWNAIRFAMSKLGDDYTPPNSVNPSIMPFSCQWILSALNKAVGKTVSSLEAYEFSDAASVVYSWWQFQLCDVFIEVIKPYFSRNEESFVSARGFARDVLWICLDSGLRLLHPFMPFVTEELWQRLPQPKDTIQKESIVISEYPTVIQSWTNEIVEHDMELIESAVKSLRSLKSLLPAKERYEKRQAFAVCHSKVADIVRSYVLELSTLAGLSSLKIVDEDDPALTGCSRDVVNANLRVYLQVNGTINAEAERKKLQTKLEETKRQKETLEKMMAASGYKEKVRPQIHEENMEKLTKLMQQVLSLEKATQHLDQDIALPQV